MQIITDPCINCGSVAVIETTNELAAEQLAQPRAVRPHIQTILPDVSPAERGRFISGWCGDCFDALIPNDDE